MTRWNCSKKNSFRHGWTLGCLLFVGAATAAAQPEPANPAPPPPTAPQAAADQAPPVPPPMLDAEYVDILNGFSFRPPAGFQIFNQLTSIETLANNPLPIQSEPPFWDAIRVPPSKRLACFAGPQKQHIIIITLLVTRFNLTIEKMLETRKEYWLAKTQKMDIISQQTEIIHDLPVARLVMACQQQYPALSSIQFSEALFQHDKNRYFSILTIETNISEHPDNRDIIYQAMLSNFQCLNPADLQKTWIQARQFAQQLIADATHTFPAPAQPYELWYQILYRNQDIGFRHIRYQPQMTNNKIVGQWTIDDFLQNGLAAEEFAKSQGLWLIPPSENASEATPLTGPIQITTHMTLNSDPFQESFDCDFYDRHQAGPHLIAKGNWMGKALKYTVRSPQDSENKNSEDTLELNEKLYLPFSGQLWLGKILKFQKDEKLIFVRFANRALGYYAVRIADKVDWTPPALTLTKTENEKTDLPAAKPIIAWKTLCHMDTDGLILESWFDTTGYILQQRFDDLTVVRSTMETIKNNWPDEVLRISTP